MPAPVGPQRAMISPGATCRSTPESTSLPVPYEKKTPSNWTSTGPDGIGRGSAVSGIVSIPWSHAKLRDAEAVARWASDRIQPSASSGHTICRSSW